MGSPFVFRKTEPWPHVIASDWRQWTWQMRHGLSSRDDFARLFALSPAEVAAFAQPQLGFQVRSTPYYAGLVDSAQGEDDPIRRMILPRIEELELGLGQQVPDPLGERRHEARDRVIHRYPDRVLFLVTDQCSLYCRYCLRKHFTGQDQAFVGSESYQEALNYIRLNRGVREVILSGGDPLTLSDARLERVMSDLREIDHVEIIRIGTRMPVVCPMRVSVATAEMFRRYKPVYVMTHFNHPREVTAEAAEALETLVDHGVPVFNQMVLLNGINNHAVMVQALARRLLYLRVKPYYVFQCDPSEGSEHFRTSVEESLAIQKELWGRLSGLAMANFSLDIPGGGGKVGLVPNFSAEDSSDEFAPRTPRRFRGWDGHESEYQPPAYVRRDPPDLHVYLDEWDQVKNQTYGKS